MYGTWPNRSIWSRQYSTVEVYELNHEAHEILFILKIVSIIHVDRATWLESVNLQKMVCYATYAAMKEGLISLTSVEGSTVYQKTFFIVHNSCENRID